jgi:RNase P/RNase MRP subunit POP5
MQIGEEGAKHKMKRIGQSRTEKKTFINHTIRSPERSFKRSSFELSKTSFLVDIVDLLNRGDVGGSSDVEAEVVLVSCVHDSQTGALHRVRQARVDDVLFARSVNFLLKKILLNFKIVRKITLSSAFGTTDKFENWLWCR